VTVPVAAEGETVAVRVTLSPVVGDVVDAARSIVVEVRLEDETVSVTALDVLVA
jgi:hypothetical protein